MIRWHIERGAALPNLELVLVFVDGLSGRVRLTETELTGALERLRDPHYFTQMQIVGGVPCWPGGEELAPDALHADIRASCHSNRP
jgi:hypothetical protein